MAETSGYSVNFGNEWQWVDGVKDGTFRNPEDAAACAVKVRRDTLTKRDYAGPVLGLSPSDIPFQVWGLPAGTRVEPSGTLVVDSVSYRILGGEVRGDLAQARIYCREKVS